MSTSLKIVALATVAAVTACSSPASQPSLPGSHATHDWSVEAPANDRAPARSSSARRATRRQGTAQPIFKPRTIFRRAIKGNGQVVAVVDAYDNPNVSADLANFIDLPTAYRRQTSRNITKLGRRRTILKATRAWGTDIDLAVEMISASCPACTIDLVEANSAAFPTSSKPNRKPWRSAHMSSPTATPAPGSTSHISIRRA